MSLEENLDRVLARHQELQNLMAQAQTLPQRRSGVSM